MNKKNMHAQPKLFSLFITCPAGVESLLKNELQELGLNDLRETVTGVFAEASETQLYQVNLWSRLANRVLLLLKQAKPGNANSIYEAVASIPWEEHLPEGTRFCVDFAGTSDAIRNSQYGAQLVKDGIVDRVQQSGAARPEVDRHDPQIRVNVRLTKRTLYIGLDLSGESLHKRGYRGGGGYAPLKENLAAALLLRSKWAEHMGANSLVDPMCGSGTFLIEAAMLARDIAPGSRRERFGFEGWKGFDAKLWSTCQSEAKVREQEGRKRILPKYLGFEIDARISQYARENIAEMELEDDVFITEGELQDIAPEIKQGLSEKGLVIANPPYGVRLGDKEALKPQYRQLADAVRNVLPAWDFALLSNSKELFSETRLRASKSYRVMNGPIECELKLYSINAKASDETDSQPKNKALSAGAEMVANRLRKNLRKLKSLRTNGETDCFRVYDADLPEYSAAIDVYGKYVHVQEYKAPSSVDKQRASQRFKELCSAVRFVFELQYDELFTKVRQRNRGADQYEKHAASNTSFIEVKEGKAKFLVDLQSYLDTGLFLDHRLLRGRIFNEAKGKRFLNLFSYTSTASVHAVLGGAIASTSVDMSNTYVEWSQKNFELNKIRSKQHEIVRDDVLVWLKKCRVGYDLIMLDPPSFSNSKKMSESFDVQRDHLDIVLRCMEILDPQGTLYFSNNLKSFELNEELSKRFRVTDITQETIDVDFQRNKKIHRCFKLEHMQK